MRAGKVLARCLCSPQGHWGSRKASGSLAGSTINVKPFATPNLLEAQMRKLFYPELSEAYVKSTLHLCIKLAHQNCVLG